MGADYRTSTPASDSCESARFCVLLAERIPGRTPPQAPGTVGDGHEGTLVNGDVPITTPTGEPVFDFVVVTHVFTSETVVVLAWTRFCSWYV